MINIMQGDERSIGVELLLENGTVVTDGDVKDIEVTIGLLSKSKKNGQIAFIDGLWILRLSQAETLAFRNTAQKAQVRVLWPTGEVEGVSLGRIYIGESLSRKELG